MGLNQIDLSQRVTDGLLFDAEGITLISRFSDELSAYRARRQWVDILGSYFLLEKGRDFEMSVLANPESEYFVLNCFFTSACGRYAFWRLINEQAPEAESKLSAHSGSLKRPGYFSTLFGSLSDAKPMPAVLGGCDSLSSEFYSDSSFMGKLKRFLR